MPTVGEERRVRRVLRRAGQGMTGNGTGGGGGRGRRSRLLVAGGLVVAAVATAAVAVGVLSGSGRKAGTDGGIKGSATATVARRDLVDTDSESGTLGYADARTVVNRLTGTITWLPREGSIVRRGRTLYKVDAKPVVLMYGGQPAYRALAVGVSSGRDVLQLERNLEALGYDPGVADGVFTLTTAVAVARWQDGMGLPVTGRVGLGRVAFLPGARRIGTISATLGGSASQSGGGSGGASASADTATSSSAGGATFVDASYTVADDTTTATTPSATTPTTQTPTQTTPQQQQTQPSQPNQQQSQSQQQQQGSTQQSAPSGSASSAQSSGTQSRSSGSSAAQVAANDVMDTTSTTRLVTVDLDTTKQTLARKHARVEVELPSGDVARGRISGVGKVAKAESSSSDSGSGSQDSGSTTSTLTVEIRLTGHPRLGSLDQTPVTVRFAQETRRHVLSVPVTALLATAGGRFAVVAVQDGARRRLPAEPGLSAGGYVEVSGPGIHPGLRVVDSASE